MAVPAERNDDAVALQRFGLGRRAGRPLDNIRDRLLDDIRQKRLAPAGDASLGTTTQIGAGFYAFQDERRADRRMASAAPPAQGEALPRMQPSPPPAEGAPPPPRPEPPFPQRIYRDEVRARVEGALAAETGFGERLAQFWTNHFCVSVAKSGFLRAMAGVYEREAIRPHVFGRFEEMLLAAESHPAMLGFLDNQQSIGPNSPAGRRRGRGLNENLAREILELHTLGVNGGYGQADVTSLAGIITGWTVVGRDGVLGFPGGFAFNNNVHEPGDKALLGTSYGQPGAAQGVAALRDLAHHPATADHIALKLARHFVADEPPPALVRELARVFKASEGDLATVATSLLQSREAWRAPATKLRTPQEFLIAAARAFGRAPEVGQILGPLATMGQRLWQPGGPNGYPDRVEAWATPEGIKTRIDVAAAWGRQAAGLVADPRALTEDILGPLASVETRQAVARAESKPQALALLLMSPEFQRR